MTNFSGRKVAIVASFSGTGGVERMISNLSAGFAGLGTKVDLLMIRKDNLQYLRPTPSMRLLPLSASHNLSAIPEIASYLRRERPDAVLAAKDRAILAVAVARRLAGSRCRVVGRLGTTVSAGISHRSVAAKWLRKTAMRRAHAMIDATICVSKGVAADLASITGLPLEKFPVVPNPVVTPDLFEKAARPAPHPWLAEPGVPVIVGMGRLTKQKGFDVLIRAFASVRRSAEVRLLILGEGRERERLEAAARELGIAEEVDLPGFTPDPYPILARASLFVLSSRWEGSPNALTEALALGVPAVATDCPSGPREILQDGRVAPLVPVDDHAALASAILEVLAAPPDEETLKAAAAPYSQEASARRYLEIMLGHCQARTVPPRRA